LNKNTSRAFYVLNEFFADIVKVIAQTLKEVDNEVLILNNAVNNESTLLASEIREIIDEIKSHKDKIGSVNKEIDELKSEVEILDEKIVSFDSKISVLKKTEDFKSVSTKSEEKVSCEENISLLKSELDSLFSKLNSALKKYGHFALDSKLVNEYLSGPVLALKSDDELKIYDILIDVKDKTEKGTFSAVIFERSSLKTEVLSS